MLYPNPCYNEEYYKGTTLYYDHTFNIEFCCTGCLANGIYSNTGVVSSVIWFNLINQESIIVFLADKLHSWAFLHEFTILQRKVIVAIIFHVAGKSPEQPN